MSMREVRELARGTTRRVVIEGVTPAVDGGRFAAKASVGEPVDVRADVFVDGHDRVGASFRWQAGDETPRDVRMRDLGNDRWSGVFVPERPGLHTFTVSGWIDTFATWRADLVKRLAAGQDLTQELLVGAPLVASAARRAEGDDAERLQSYASRLKDPAPTEAAELSVSEELAALMARHEERRRGAAQTSSIPVWVDRARAAHGAWYELFPRSAAPEPGRHGTLRDVAALVPDLAEAGFDVLYLPPIHPIGRTNRKGPNNATRSAADDPGSPWAIGSQEGGHTAIHPELGTFDDFAHLVAELKRHDMEIALDLAFQCAPDHPWVKEHPSWFRHRPDGSIRFAENPPKKYEDIYPLDFESRDRDELWHALLDVVRFWIDRDVRIFRVDNPHTKPFPFWEWLIGQVRVDEPDVLFLSEAFTRPKVMYRLAKLGFTQSYTYFAWRHEAADLRAYFEELTAPPVADFFRPNLWPNTPDILTGELQHGGPPAFRLRLLLAATLGANYGIYGPAFEHLEREPREAGSEEYLDSEKYEVRWRHPAGGAGMRELITKVNAIRRRHPALQQDRRLAFHFTDNPMLLAYSKRSAAGDDVVLTIVNLDPRFPQAGFTGLRMAELGLEPNAPFQVRDLLTGSSFAWSGGRNYVELHPARQAGHILHITSPSSAVAPASDPGAAR
jgi:starch synthase (maltosyl-transferring)